MEIIEQLAAFIKDHGERDLRLFIERRDPPDQAVFINRLYEDLDEAIDELERTAHELQRAQENHLRTRLVHHLRHKGYDARAEADERGHADILVENRKVRVVWLGEAKRHNDYKWLAKGLSQLHTRYSTGRHTDMALLVFVPGANAKAVMDEWRQRLNQQAYCSLIAGSCSDDLGGKLRFSSRHQHVGSGLELRTRHIFASMHFAPKDSA